MTATIGGTSLLNAKQVGKRIGRCEKTVLLYARQRKIACVKQSARSVLFTPEAVEDYLASRTVTAAAPAAAARSAKPKRNPRYTR